MTTNEAVSLLRPIKLFSTMQDEQLVDIFRLATYNEGRESDYILNQGEAGEEIYVILSGVIEVEVDLPDDKGREVIAKLGPGDVIGELCLVGVEKRSASARALGNVAYLSWRKSDMLALFKSKQGIGYEFMNRMAEILASRLIHTNQDLSYVFYQVFHAG